MRLIPGLILALLIAPVIVRGERALDDARLARQMLGPEIWSQVIRVENVARSSRYPRVVHALVFELAGILWFYAGVDGTQSFSLHRDRLVAEKADYGPLLADIEPGFVRWSVLPDAEPGTPFRGRRLPNGCFVESVAALRNQLAAGIPVTRSGLLSYYPIGAPKQGGHTVLVFESRDEVRVIDPLRPRATIRFPRAWADNPRRLAQALEAAPIGRARFLPVEPRQFRTELVQGAPGPEPAVVPAAGV